MPNWTQRTDTDASDLEESFKFLEYFRRPKDGVIRLYRVVSAVTCCWLALAQLDVAVSLCSPSKPIHGHRCEEGMGI